MYPRRFILAALVITTICPAAPADEPSYRGRSLTQWREMLATDPKPSRRQAALMVIEVLGVKDPTTVRAVGRAVRTDVEPDVRQRAAQILGNLGAEAREAIDDLAAAAKADTNTGVRA